MISQLKTSSTDEPATLACWWQRAGERADGTDSASRLARKKGVRGAMLACCGWRQAALPRTTGAISAALMPGCRSPGRGLSLPRSGVLLHGGRR